MMILPKLQTLSCTRQPLPIAQANAKCLNPEDVNVPEMLHAAQLMKGKGWRLRFEGSDVRG